MELLDSADEGIHLRLGIIIREVSDDVFVHPYPVPIDECLSVSRVSDSDIQQLVQILRAATPTATRGAGNDDLVAGGNEWGIQSHAYLVVDFLCIEVHLIGKVIPLGVGVLGVNLACGYLLGEKDRSG